MKPLEVAYEVKYSKNANLFSFPYNKYIPRFFAIGEITETKGILSLILIHLLISSYSKFLIRSEIDRIWNRTTRKETRIRIWLKFSLITIGH